METLKTLLELAKEHGPLTAAWVVLFAIVAFVAGKGGKMALSNVQSLLDQSAALRQTMADQLASANRRVDELNAQLADANANAASLRALLNEALDGQRSARESMILAQTRADELRQQHDALHRDHIALQAELRDTLLALSIARATPNGATTP